MNQETEDGKEAKEIRIKLKRIEARRLNYNATNDNKALRGDDE